LFFGGGANKFLGVQNKFLEVQLRWKKAAECCRIFAFDSPSRQFIFNVWVRAAISIRWHCKALQIVNMPTV